MNFVNQTKDETVSLQDGGETIISEIHLVQFFFLEFNLFSMKRQLREWVSRIFLAFSFSSSPFTKFTYGCRLVKVSNSSCKSNLTYDRVKIYEMEDVWRFTCVSCTPLIVIVSLWLSSSWKHDVPKAPFPEPRAQFSSGWCYEAWESCSVFSIHLQWR